MKRFSFAAAADRLGDLIRDESNGMARFYVALDGDDDEKIAALADELSRRLPAVVIPTSAFSLPARSLTPERAALPGGAFDYERFTREVARPFLAKKLPLYGVYSEQVRGTVERVQVKECGVYLIAGRYALHPEIPDFYDLRVVLKSGEAADDAVRAYLSAYMIEEFSDVLVTPDAGDDEPDPGFSGFSLPLSFDGDL
ncbi:MAG: hypothetical protein J6X72_05315 [Clostridia bacterium]|nr:hypothetical protein [Clostridia bacterium]